MSLLVDLVKRVMADGQLTSEENVEVQRAYAGATLEERNEAYALVNKGGCKAPDAGIVPCSLANLFRGLSGKRWDQYPVTAGGSGVSDPGKVAFVLPGSEEDKAFRGVLDLSRKGLVNIYREALRRNPNLKGNVAVELSVMPDGKVGGVRVVETEIKDKDFLAKYTNFLKGTVLPGHEKGSILVWKYEVKF